MKRKIIALDFDSTCTADEYEWQGVEFIPDKPLPGCFRFIQDCFNAGYYIVIHSCRASEPAGKQAILQWFADHGLGGDYLCKLKVTSEKPRAVLYIDDKGFSFNGVFPSIDFIREFKPWNRK